MRTFTLVGLAALLVGCGNQVAKTTHQSVMADDGVVPGAIVVDCKDDVSDSDIAELSKIARTELHADNPTAQKYKYEEGVVDPSNEDTILEQLKADPRVEHAERMVEYKALGFTPNDPMYNKQWGLTRIGTETSWGMACGTGVKVAILDDGVNCKSGSKKYPKIADLAECSGGYSFADNGKEEAGGTHPHGGHVSSTVAELTDNNLMGAGVAPCVRILPVKVLSDSGSGTNEGIAEGVRFATDQGAQVINMSFGGPFPSEILEDAVNYAHDHGVLVVCAAGNSGGSVSYPAAFKNSLAVSAIGQDDKITSFSSRGPQIAIAAPGKDIGQSTICEGGGNPDGCFETYSGTSMSSPHVAGVAALLYGQGITNPDAVKEKLQSTADPKNDAKLYGSGILRADKAVQSTILSHMVYRLLALLSILFLMRKTIKDQWKNRYTLAGIVFSGIGMVPIFFSGLMPRLGSFRIVAEVLARPLGEMDIVMSGFAHSTLLLASAIPTAIATLLMLSHNKLKYLAGGIGLGAMALEAQIAYSNDTRFIFGSLAMRAFMVVSMLVCAYFVRGVFQTKQS